MANRDEGRDLRPRRVRASGTGCRLMARRPEKHAKTPTAKEIDQNVAAYVARGGKIEIIPMGVSGEKRRSNWTAKNRAAGDKP